jgi:hypothetical protein
MTDPRPNTDDVRAKKEREQRRKQPPKPEKPQPTHQDPVDESSDESFPASDPPAHGGGDRRP